jgi:altronate dehydratase
VVLIAEINDECGLGQFNYRELKQSPKIFANVGCGGIDHDVVVAAHQVSEMVRRHNAAGVLVLVR